MKTVDLTLRITYDEERNLPPANWDWNFLLLMDENPGDRVVVIDSKEISNGT